MLLTADPQLGRVLLRWKHEEKVGISMTKLLFVVHDDVADAVPACKDAGGGGKGMGLLFSGVLVCSKNRAARCCFEHFPEE